MFGPPDIAERPGARQALVLFGGGVSGVSGYQPQREERIRSWREVFE